MAKILKKKVGITGASGNLGKNIIKKYNSKYKFLKFSGSVINKKEIFNWVKNNNFEFIIHLAAKVPIQLVEKKYINSLKVNYEGTKNLVDAINFYDKKNINWFFFASTAQVYNYSPIKIREKSNYGNISKYGYSKIKAEKYIIKHLRKNVRFCIGRIFSFTSIQQDSSFFIPSIFNRIKNSKTSFFSYERLDQRRDFIHIHDLSRAIIFLMKKKYNNIINIGSGKEIKLDFIIKYFANKFKKEIIYKKKSGNRTKNDLCPNIEKLKKLGFRSKFNINHILKDFIN